MIYENFYNLDLVQSQELWLRNQLLNYDDT